MQHDLITKLFVGILSISFIYPFHWYNIYGDGIAQTKSFVHLLYACQWISATPYSAHFNFLYMSPIWCQLLSGNLDSLYFVNEAWALAKWVKLRDAHTPRMPGMFSPPSRISDPDMHHGTCVTHVPWCLPKSLTSGLLWSRGGEIHVPAIPGACATRKFTYLERCPL